MSCSGVGSGIALLQGYARWGGSPPLRRYQRACRTYSRQFLRNLLGRLKFRMTLRRCACIAKHGCAKESAKPSRAATGSEILVRVTCETSFALPVDLTPKVWGVNIRSLGNNFSPLVFPIFLFRRVSFC
jgi:hypothetical protein